MIAAERVDIIELVKLRELRPEDTALIYSSWLKSYRGSDFARAFSNQIYFEGQRRLISQILRRASVAVACSIQDDSHIYGWICFERYAMITGVDRIERTVSVGHTTNVLHYLYVKNPFRGFGLSQVLLALLPREPLIYTHQGSFARKLPPGSVYNPWAVLGGE